MRSRGQAMRLGALAVTVAALGAAVAASGGGAAGTSTLVLTPVADSFVRADRPARTFGKAASLVVARRPLSVAFLRFRVVVPSGEAVVRATLELFVSGAGSGFTVHRVGGGWSERSVTFASAPRVGARVAVSPGARRGGSYVSADVSALVRGGGAVSLALRSAGGASLSFGSREAAGGRPRLLVETAAAAGGGVGVRPCGLVARPGRVEHVVWIWMENKPFGAVIGSAAAPFENELAAACGLATGYRGIAHPSLPNYVAATSGSTQGIADDGPPAAHPLEVASIYSQLRAAGRSWRDYEEGAPGPCPLASGGAYAVRHDPAPYYSGIRADCALWDVPMGTTAGGSFLADLDAGTLPAFAFVTPDLCHGTHDCPVATGDAWLQAWFAKILASPAYQAGDTVVFLTWDEDDGSAANHVPLIVVSPSTVPGTRSPLPADHYALLKTTEQLLGLTPLGHAADPATPTLTTTFNLG